MVLIFVSNVGNLKNKKIKRGIKKLNEKIKLTKKCSKCKKILPLNPTYFYKNSWSSNGYRSECKECRRNSYIIKGLTKRDPKLELINVSNIKDFKQDCDKIYDKSRKTIGYNEITIDLGDDDCVIKTFNDSHVGNEMTRMDLIGNDVELVQKTDRMFEIWNGDYTDNLDALKGQAGVYESIMSVPEAKQKIKDNVMLLKDKILAIVLGCHDNWFFRQDGWDIAQYLASHTKFGYWLGFRGIVNIILGEQKYRFHVRHRYRRHSTDNETWGMLYKFRKLKVPVDVMMSAHHHHPTIRVLYERGQIVYLLMGGAYKPYDRFIEQRDIDEGIPLMPAMYLRSDKHQLIPFLDFKEAADIL